MTLNQAPHYRDYNDPETMQTNWDKYYSDKAKWEKSQQTFSHSYRLKLDELLESQDWAKAIKFAKETNFSEKDKAFFNKKINEIAKENGGFDSDFGRLYGRELLSVTLKKAEKNAVYIQPIQPKTAEPTQKANYWPWILYLAVGAGLIWLVIEYWQILLFIAVVAFIIVMLGDVLANAKNHLKNP